MKIEIKKGLIYRYVWYRFKRKCLNSTDFNSMSESDKENFCIDTAKKVMLVFILFGIIFMGIMMLFMHHILIKPQKNIFDKWFIDTLSSANEIIQGSWGVGMRGKRRVVLQTFFTLLPIILVVITPLLIFIGITVNLLIQFEINKKIKKS